MVVLGARFGFILSEKNTGVRRGGNSQLQNNVEPAQHSSVQADMIDETSFTDFKIFLYALAGVKTRTNEM